MEEIFRAEEDFIIYPITNYRTMLLFENPDFSKLLEEGEGELPAEHPNQYICFLYNSETGESEPFSPVDIGYEVI